MNKVNREAIKALLESEDSASISIYLPTHRFPTSEHIQEDKIRFKNLVRASKEVLRTQDVDDGTTMQIASELDSVYDDNNFWQHTTEGLAVFCSPAGIQCFHLPMECQEHVSAGDSYDIAPLLAVASYDRPYYLLALAMHRPVLYKGDMCGLERVDIELPESPEKALNIDELHSNSQTVRAGGYGAGNPGMKSHGQGDSKQAGQEERLKFFRIIDDKILSSKLVDTNLPFLLAGTDDEVSGYRETSRIKHLLASCLSGNYTETAAHEIHVRSWPLVMQEIGSKEQLNTIEKAGNLLGTGRSSTSADEIASVADEGRVDTLALGMLTTTRDSIRDGNRAITKLIFPDRYEVDGIAASARSVFRQGGKVVGIIQGNMLNGASMAAVYRY